MNAVLKVQVRLYIVLSIWVIHFIDVMALIVDGDEMEVDTVKVAPGGQGKSQFWDSQLPSGSAPSSIHSDSSHGSNRAMSDDSSVMESINGRTRDRILTDSDKADKTIQSVQLCQLLDDSDPACSYVDVANIQLDETLKSLRETKTPMLPSRLRTAVKPYHSTVLSATFAEPQKVSLGAGGIITSTHYDVPFAWSERSNHVREHSPSQLPRHRDAKRSVDADSQSDADADCKAARVIEFLNGSYHEFPEKSPVQSKHGRSADLSLPESRVEAVDWNLSGANSGSYRVQSLPAELSVDVHSSAVASSIPTAAESELLQYSAAIRDTETSALLTVPDTDNLDSLIARYRNLRDSATVARTSSNTSACQISGNRVESEAIAFAKHSAPTSVAVLNLTAANIKDTSETVNQSRSTLSQDMLKPTVVGPHIQQSPDSVGNVNGAAVADLEDDLCNDNFEDIQLSLQNISIDSARTPLHVSFSQPKGLCCEMYTC